MAANLFSAADPALGYLYQIRLALLLSLRRLRSNPDFAVSIEVLDDVAFEKAGSPPELLQTKHHLSSKANLTDASPDLWKTIRVWIEGTEAGTTPPNSVLCLVTTSIASPGSAASLLKDMQRNPASALKILTETARTSKNKENELAYAAFSRVSEKTREAIVAAIRILDGARSIVEIEQDLLGEVTGVASRKHRPSCLERIEGWWFGRVIQQLTSPSGSNRIAGQELDLKIDDLREQFSRDSLPVDADVAGIRADDPRLLAHVNSQFVLQLNLVVPGSRRVLLAIRDYYRAYTQRSRWVREHLLLVGELERYETLLIEAWELYFEARLTELGSTATDERKREIALKVLEWGEACCTPIRQKVADTFVARGSLHMLADDLKVGWHPEFRARMAALLKVPSAGTA